MKIFVVVLYCFVNIGVYEGLRCFFVCVVFMLYLFVWFVLCVVSYDNGVFFGYEVYYGFCNCFCCVCVIGFGW